MPQAASAQFAPQPGVASTSLHGWLWIAAALPGCWIGLALLRRFAPR